MKQVFLTWNLPTMFYLPGIFIFPLSHVMSGSWCLAMVWGLLVFIAVVLSVFSQAWLLSIRPLFVLKGSNASFLFKRAGYQPSFKIPWSHLFIICHKSRFSSCYSINWHFPSTLDNDVKNYFALPACLTSSILRQNDHYQKEKEKVFCSVSQNN